MVFHVEDSATARPKARYDSAMRIFRGTVEGIDAAKRQLEDRGRRQDDSEERRRVEEILAAVRDEGDAAVRRFSERFDGVALEDYRVPPQGFEEAREEVAEDLLAAIAEAARRVRTFYEHQPKEGFLLQGEGGLLGQLVRPLERVALYVPGGTAPLFSTLLMLGVPARVAGVPDLVVITPPRKDGSVAPEILVAAELLDIDTVYRIGGAQAIAALAYGTETIPRADKIVGPGNRYVVLAKRLVYGEVGIEALPGPTETLIVADERAKPEHVVADLLAQAEHFGAQPVLVTTSQALIAAVEEELERQLSDLGTAAAARESLMERGLIVLVETLQEALDIANLYAPEHLCLLVEDRWSLLPLVKNAGGIFLGESSMEALGDYNAGPSHVMPTGGTARFSSAVNVRDFQKVIPLVGLSQEAVESLGPGAARMARAEGLEAHARAIESRLRGRE
jgi:histidinol dehydrogenase